MWREIPGAVAEVTESNGVDLKWQRLCYNVLASFEAMNIPVVLRWWKRTPFYSRVAIRKDSG